MQSFRLTNFRSFNFHPARRKGDISSSPPLPLEALPSSDHRMVFIFFFLSYFPLYFPALFQTCFEVLIS